MADNIDITAGAGTTIATDDCTTGHVQVVKLAYGADGDRTQVGADANGLDVDVTRLPSIPAGSNNIGDVDVASIAAGDNNIGNVDIVTMPNVTLAAGTNTNEIVGDVAHDAAIAGNPVTIGGRASAAAPADVSADDDAVRAWMLRNGATCVQLTAAGALIPGDAANGLDVDVTRLPALVASSANIGDVDVLTVPADPFGVNADAASATGSISAKLRFMAATGIPITSIAAGDNNIGNVDVVTMPNVTLAAGTNTNEVVGDAAHDAAAAGNPLLVGGYASAAAPADVSADADVVRAWMLRNGATCVNLTAAGTLIASGNGTAATALRVSLASDSTGQVAVASLPASTNTLEVVGDVAHDAAAAGNPLLVCGIAQDMDDTAPPNVVSAEGDATRIATDRDGAVFVHPHGPRVWSYHVNGSAALTDASVHAAPAAGLSLYVTDIIISLGAATALNVFFEEGATTVLGPFYLEAVNGRGLHIKFATPKKITAATALTVTSSASVAHSIDVLGYTAQG